MVRGLNVFKQYFGEYTDNYVIIGGTACDIIIGDAGFTPRATKDIDIILVVEALSPQFIKQFWQFIKDGKYERNEKAEGDRKYYRFIKPENTDFPYQLELFSRNPDLELGDGAHLTPIPADDDLSSLSAILLNDEYYGYMIEHSVVEQDLHRANTEALICLKAKAYLEIEERVAKGSKEDNRQLNKHKNDVLRLTAMLAADDVFELPEIIQEHMNAFAEKVKGNLPDKAIFKDMGMGNIDVQVVFDQFAKNFQIKP